MMPTRREVEINVTSRNTKTAHTVPTAESDTVEVKKKTKLTHHHNKPSLSVPTFNRSYSLFTFFSCATAETMLASLLFFIFFLCWYVSQCICICPATLRMFGSSTMNNSVKNYSCINWCWETIFFPKQPQRYPLSVYAGVFSTIQRFFWYACVCSSKTTFVVGGFLWIFVWNQIALFMNVKVFNNFFF